MTNTPTADPSMDKLAWAGREAFLTKFWFNSCPVFLVLTFYISSIFYLWNSGASPVITGLTPELIRISIVLI